MDYGGPLNIDIDTLTPAQRTGNACLDCGDGLILTRRHYAGSAGDPQRHLYACRGCHERHVGGRDA